MRAHLLCISLLVSLATSAGAREAPVRALGWVGNMLPAGGSSNQITSGGSLEIFIQAWKSGVTDSPGAGANIDCELWWSEVTFFGGPWLAETATAMSYVDDVGNNDRYSVVISPTDGLYEFTARCTDTTDGNITWQQDGNGQLTVSPAGTIGGRRGIWVEDDIIAWNTSFGPGGAVTYELHYAFDGGLSVPVTSGSGIPLTFQSFLSSFAYPKYPNIGGYKALQLPTAELANVPDILKGQIAIAAYSGSGDLLEATSVQLQGVLDDLYTYNGPLGLSFDGQVPTFRLWAPTARQVNMRHYFLPATLGQPVPMTLDPATGVWELTGTADMYGDYYWYEVSVWVEGEQSVISNLVTDPYAVNLSANAARAQIIDIENDAATKPPGWDTLAKPQLDAPEDITIYELHIRDFSAYDDSIPAEHRGTFKAFSYDGNGTALSEGMAHLQALADAGLTHIHLLPVHDYADIPENPADRNDPDPALLASYPADSDQQQAIVAASKDQDSFNWGFNPVHYGVPEGSFATMQDGPTRIYEMREMVQSLSDNGLRVILDVVYNHTSSAEQNVNSVLDKIVPGYFYRLTPDGDIETSSCCNDTATEFVMAEKLMIDTAVQWVKQYKVDGFRFDLMSLHTRANMEALRDAVQALTPAADGVDGDKVYLYGEGWDTGSAKGKGLVYAYQWNMAGTGIGTFNDRIRDATHGGIETLNIFKQGFATGQAYDWNGYSYAERFQGDLRFSQDRLRIGLAGNLQNYTILDQNNNFVTGANFNGTGYTLDPQEAIQYVTKHDNYTLYDLIAYKAPWGEGGTPRTAMEERVRMQNMALSVITLSQGVPFFHAGSDILRSKSMDFNSFNSGDWFNQIDFSYQTNNFGIGLPPAEDNSGAWPQIAPLLPDTDLYPANGDIVAAAEHFREMLQIRKSSRLFRMATEGDIISRLSFHNVGSGQSDGLIVMELADDQATDLDPAYENIVVLFNANKFDQNFTVGGLAGVPFGLHPVQQASSDPRVQFAGYDTGSGNFFVPARTTAVFVSPPQAAVDSDGDGVFDATDNCREIANPDQRDTNGDGFGNRCDPDLNNDNIVDLADLAIFRIGFLTGPGDASWNPDADLDGNDSVDLQDLAIVRDFFLLPPGP
ncbi:MAG: pullulanase-type alpha-1,6-glucosidase [Gammaproteobacteria bacterium]|nr:pullulanase-type alpha-1,6-glucosidase [Gammaproteobacteria bacterium]